MVKRKIEKLTEVIQATRNNPNLLDKEIRLL